MAIRITRSIGSAWFGSRHLSCLLRVPSVVLPVPDVDDRNVLINHRHRDAAQIIISTIIGKVYLPTIRTISRLGELKRGGIDWGVVGLEDGGISPIQSRMRRAPGE